MLSPTAASSSLWGAPLDERLAVLDEALALLRHADDEVLRLLAAVRGLAHVVDWSAEAADAFRSAVSAWESELIRLSTSIDSVIARTSADRQWVEATG